MEDLFGELLVYIFGPIVAVLAVIMLISKGCEASYNYVTGKKPVVEQVQPVKKETLSHKAGHKTKEVAKDFVKGFFSK